MGPSTPDLRPKRQSGVPDPFGMRDPSAPLCDVCDGPLLPDDSGRLVCPKHG
jgi:hypothetical protein